MTRYLGLWALGCGACVDVNLDGLLGATGEPQQATPIDTEQPLIESMYATCSGLQSVSITVTSRVPANFARVWAVGTQFGADVNPEPHAEDHKLDFQGPADGVDLWQRSFALEDVEGGDWSPNVTTAFQCDDAGSTARWGYPTAGPWGDDPDITYAIRLYEGSDIVACSVFGHDPEGLLESLSGDDPIYQIQDVPTDAKEYPTACEAQR